jgi:hypothetical protein
MVFQADHTEADSGTRSGNIELEMVKPWEYICY